MNFELDAIYDYPTLIALLIYIIKNVKYSVPRIQRKPIGY